MRIRKPFVLLLALLCTVCFAVTPTAQAGINPTITLGNASNVSGTFYYPNAVVQGSSLRTLLINFTDSVTAGDKIILPSVTPAGFVVSATSATNDYAKRINFTTGTANSAIQAYVREIGIQLGSATQTVQFTVTMENIAYDTFYRATNEHYYQYIPYAPGTTGTWTDTYDAAKTMTYMGKTGYLATITSQSEDEFVNALSGGKTGWLGGTYMEHSIGETALHYDSFATSIAHAAGWYWACGPEKGDIFYNVLSLDTIPAPSNLAKANIADAANASTYFNWSRPTLDIYSTQFEPNSTEACLTTLNVTNGPLTIYGKAGTVFSWNNIAYNRGYSATDQYTVLGFFVEFGDRLLGDSGSSDSEYASAVGRLPVIATVYMPETGDASNVGVMLLLLTMSSAGMIVVLRGSKRKQARR